MNTRDTLLGVVVGITLGWAATMTLDLNSTTAIAGTSSTPEHDFALEFINSELGAAHGNLLALSAIQAGNTPAAQTQLEVSLSLNAMVIEGFIELVGPDERTNAMLVQIADYRKRYPFQSGNPEGDQSVHEILQLAQQRVRN